MIFRFGSFGFDFPGVTSLRAEHIVPPLENIPLYLYSSLLYLNSSNRQFMPGTILASSV